MISILAILRECPNCVADPDHTVGGCSYHTGEQPRPPGLQRLTPRLLGDFALEIGGPVSDPPRIAQRFLPAGADSGSRAREILKPQHVLIQPDVHAVSVASAHHGLSRHRTMVGKPAAEFWPSRMQPLVGLVKYPGRA